MSRKITLPAQIWLVVDPDGQPCIYTAGWTRRFSIQLFTSFPGQWRHNYRSGYRCVRATIRQAKKGGRK